MQRGHTFEKIIEWQNETYRRSGLGAVQKISTPTNVKAGSSGVKYWREKSTVDFLGNLDGRGIAFDAKETSGMNLPLSNIKHHQVEFLVDSQKGGAIAFFLVSFKKNCISFVLMIDDFLRFLLENKRKSIPLEFFSTYGYKIPFGMDYLAAIKGNICGN